MILSRKTIATIAMTATTAKMMMLCVVAMAVQADNVIGTGAVLRGMAVGFYLANDSLSILENAARIGVPVPQGLVNKLEQMKDTGKKA